MTGASLFLVGAGVGFGASYWYNPSRLFAFNQNQQGSISTGQDTGGGGVIAPLRDNNDLNFVARVVQRVGAGVVRINASRTVATNLPPIFDDPFFRQFFNIPDLPRQQIQQGTGSGFIISQDGIVLTNAHVVEGADRVTVTLKDGRFFEGRVLGADPVTDIAVVKIDAQDLPVVPLGDSDKVIIGEWVIAIGNPLGLDNTVTTGIVSATGRSSAEIGVGDKRLDFIQTDAAINPGNSGGPLLNARGEVIGINTAIIQNAQGLGFAIPINRAKQIADILIAQGKVEHPYIGIQMVTLTPQVKEQLKQNKKVNLDSQEGVLIVRVVPNSPAALAGLQPGDILFRIDQQDVTTSSQVQKIVESRKAGDTLTLHLLRDGQTLQVPVTLGVLPSSSN